MVKKIDSVHNNSLLELDMAPGEIVAFDNHDPEFPSPFLLAINEWIVEGFEDSPKGLKLLYSPSRKSREEWTLHVKGKILGLWSPRNWNQEYEGEKKIVPNFEMLDSNDIHNPYLVERVYSGMDAIQDALRNYNTIGLGYSADKLISVRDGFGRFIEKFGLEFLLLNQLRLKKIIRKNI